MSRIEQALRRAAVTKGSPVAASAEHASTTDESLLARFPPEGRSEVDPLLTRKVVAPRSGARGQPEGGVAGGLDKSLVLSQTSPVAVEQYRRLAGVLHDMQGAHGSAVLMVSSTVPREGKTLTVANLALTLSESYKRSVLLIDADLRRPSIHELFSLPNTRGLSESLRDDTSDVAPLVLSPRLSVLPAGTADPNPLAGLTSDRMRALLERSTAEFDWVLLDAPPVGVMPDANLLARLTQGVIFVIAAGWTPYALVDRALNEIGRENVVGTVLNRMSEADIPAIDTYKQYYCASEPTR